MGRPSARSAWSTLVAHPVASTAVLSAVAAGWHLWWIAAHRHQGGFDGDETGYLATSLTFHRGLESGGVGQLLDQVVHNYRVGPLVPLLSVPFAVVGGRSVTWLMVVQPLLYATVAVTVAAIVARVSTRPAALVAGVVSLGLPVSIISARSYHLAIGSAAFLCLAVLALVSSRRGENRRWMVVLGLSVGAMMITRTASIAFLPGLALAAAVQVRWTRRVVGNVVLGVGAAAVVAAPWWITSWQSISDYLFKFGYGSGSTELGPSSPLVRALVRLGVLLVEVRLLLVVPGVVALGVVVRHVWLRRRDGRPWPTWSRDLSAIWIATVGGFVGLLTSSNIGTYLQSPLVALLVAAVVATAGRVGGRVIRVAATVAMAVAVVNTAALSYWRIGSGVPISETSASIMLFGGVETAQAINFTDGDPRFSAAADPGERARAEREWARAANEVARTLERIRTGATPTVTTFVGDIRLFEAGTLYLATELTAEGIAPWEAPTARSAVGDGVVDLAPWSGDRSRVVVAVDSERRVPQEGLDPSPVLHRAQELGWEPEASVDLPDGGKVQILVHPDSWP